MNLLKEKLSRYNIVLASQSPRRQELLKTLDIDFEVRIIDDINEDFPTTISTNKVAEYLANKKFDEYIKSASDNDLIITADTTVCINENILNKPKDVEDAKQMLNLLSGNIHEVISGVCIGTKMKKKSFSVSTKVTFGCISKDEIEYYIYKYKPFDKAGAYGIQEWIGATTIEEIKGSYFNVVGLPIQRLYKELLEFTNHSK